MIDQWQFLSYEEITEIGIYVFFIVLLYIMSLLLHKINEEKKKNEK